MRSELTYGLDLLRPRWLETFKYMALGYSITQTAEKMCISRRTTIQYRGSVKEILNIHSDANATAIALACGMITLGECIENLPGLPPSNQEFDY